MSSRTKILCQNALSDKFDEFQTGWLPRYHCTLICTTLICMHCLWQTCYMNPFRIFRYHTNIPFGASNVLHHTEGSEIKTWKKTQQNVINTNINHFSLHIFHSSQTIIASTTISPSHTAFLFFKTLPRGSVVWVMGRPIMWISQLWFYLINHN